MISGEEMVKLSKWITPEKLKWVFRTATVGASGILTTNCGKGERVLLSGIVLGTFATKSTKRKKLDTMYRMKLRSKAERDEILNEIFKLYPTKTIELDFETPFQLLAAVMLSAQMTDKGVNKATKKLFELVKTPADLLKLEPETVEVMLRGVNYYRVKTKHLFMTAEKLLLNKKSVFHSVHMPNQNQVFRGTTVGASGKQIKDHKAGERVSVPLNTFGTFGNKSTEALKYMQTLPGVGIKTAKVVLSHLYDMPFIGVDTHIHRVMNRMGIVKTKTPEETDKKLEKLLSEDQKRTMHHAIVLFGRYICTAKKCKCSETPLAKWCGREECRKINKPLC